MFDDFLKELTKPSWWMGVVVVGFLINLASAYVKPLIDRVLGNFWLASKVAVERKEAVILERARELIGAPMLVIELKLDILKQTLRAVFFIAFAIVCFLFIVLSQNETLVPLLTYPFDPANAVPIGNVFLLVLGSAQFAMASFIFSKSFDGERILRAYKKLKCEADASANE